MRYKPNLLLVKAIVLFCQLYYRNILDSNIAQFTEITSCLLANMSICSTTQSADEFLVVVYNPLSWTVNQAVRLPVEADSYTIQGLEGSF